MMTKEAILVGLLCLPLLCSGAEPQTNASVTVAYEGSYVTQPDGKQVQKVVTIPWTNCLTIVRAIAVAGGYGTPPHRHIYLARNGRTTLLPDPRQAETDEQVLRLRPGDKVEFKGPQNQASQAIGAPGAPQPER